LLKHVQKKREQRAVGGASEAKIIYCVNMKTQGENGAITVQNGPVQIKWCKYGAKINGANTVQIRYKTVQILCNYNTVQNGANNM
jgi:hypothetical protein